MSGKRIVRVFYIDVRGVNPNDVPSFMENVSKPVLSSKNDTVELIFVPVRSETKIEHFVLDLDEVKIANVMEYATLEELRRQYPSA